MNIVLSKNTHNPGKDKTFTRPAGRKNSWKHAPSHINSSSDSIPGETCSHSLFNYKTGVKRKSHNKASHLTSTGID